VLVVTEGEVTEVQYVQGLLQHLRTTGVAVRPATTKGIGRDPLRVLHEAERIAGADPDGFDSVWLLVDVDDHARLAECIKAAQHNSFEAVVSNPCFEIWLLWHFEDMNAEQSRDWLRRRLRGHGQDGKALKPGFPFGAHIHASARATDPLRLVTPGRQGGNPSTSMPSFVERLSLS
jgi:hypothetical protein